MGAGMIGGITSTAMGTVGTIFSAIAGMKADKKLSKLLEEDPKYAGSNYMKNMYGLAQNRLNGRMTGAAAAERNLYSNAGNTIAATNRMATDPSQAAAYALAAQGQADQGFENLAMNEAADYNNKYGQLNDASGAMLEEDRFKFDDELRRWQDKINTTMTQYKMRVKGGSDIGQLGSGLSGMGGGSGGGGGGMSMGSRGGGMGGGGGMSGGGGGPMPMSDKRLKHNYQIVGKSPSGINIWEFSYLGSDDRYVGVMAQEVPNAAVMTDSGFYAVDYSKTDVQFKQVK